MSVERLWTTQAYRSRVKNCRQYDPLAADILGLGHCRKSKAHSIFRTSVRGRPGPPQGAGERPKHRGFRRPLAKDDRLCLRCNAEGSHRGLPHGGIDKRSV
ncbi:hypothetical protein I553_0347 [Mycobacterium xenopi 4042]|uniref:Uncharacterized protein n=1 Tax=Mycobacterium xenopi 4042 TaxID=1299334 RepID=X7YJN6_MYCXE|nr:hypothetical protein I553_0347 [Mycobacterium xenopi 4042]